MDRSAAYMSVCSQKNNNYSTHSSNTTYFKIPCMHDPQKLLPPVEQDSAWMATASSPRALRNRSARIFRASPSELCATRQLAAKKQNQTRVRAAAFIVALPRHRTPPSAGDGARNARGACLSPHALDDSGGRERHVGYTLRAVESIPKTVHSGNTARARPSREEPSSKQGSTGASMEETRRSHGCFLLLSWALPSVFQAASASSSGWSDRAGCWHRHGSEGPRQRARSSPCVSPSRPCLCPRRRQQGCSIPPERPSPSTPEANGQMGATGALADF